MAGITTSLIAATTGRTSSLQVFLNLSGLSAVLASFSSLYHAICTNTCYHTPWIRSGAVSRRRPQSLTERKYLADTLEGGGKSPFCIWIHDRHDHAPTAARRHLSQPVTRPIESDRHIPAPERYHDRRAACPRRTCLAPLRLIWSGHLRAAGGQHLTTNPITAPGPPHSESRRALSLLLDGASGTGAGTGDTTRGSSTWAPYGFERWRNDDVRRHLSYRAA
jgi:hypothetical protein